MPSKKAGFTSLNMRVTLRKVKSRKSSARNMAVLYQFPGLGKDLSLIGDVPVTDIRTEERVQADAERKQARA